jgi:hypothetical protein
MPAVVAVGYGGLFTVLIIPMEASVSSVEDTGLAVGLLVFFRLLGGLIGLALGSTIFSSVFGKSVAALGTLPSSLAVLENSNQAVGFIPHLRELRSTLSPRDLANIISVYSRSFQTIWLVLVGFSCVGFISSLLTKEVTIEKEELGRQRFEPSEKE